MFKFSFIITAFFIGSLLYNKIADTDTFKDVSTSFKGFYDSDLVQTAVAGGQNGKNIESLSGRIVAVSDGDTATVRTEYGDVIIRLFAIDAPEATCHGFSDKVCTERGQPGATDSKLYLRKLILDKPVIVTLGQGRSGNRLVGTIFVDGVDVNLAMVEAGHAWHYKYYAKYQSYPTQKIYTQAENSAKQMKTGLWSQNNPMPPWNYRRQYK